jgi:hypothetical protein
MAVYKIFPNKDTTLYSKTPYKNTGLDSIVEVSVKNSQDYQRYAGVVPVEYSPYYSYDFAYSEYYNATASNQPEVISRALISFSDEDITALKNFSSGSFKASLKLYLAFAQSISENYILECLPVSQNWTMGTGQYTDYPYNNTGGSWTYTGQYANSPTWSAALGTVQYLYQSGGGSWNSNYRCTQSFDYNTSKDLNIDVTSIVSRWFSGSTNYGVIVKHTGSVELNTSSFFDLKFFSRDTATIYPPSIDFKWDDAQYTFNTSSNYYITTNNFIAVCENNSGEYKQDSIHSFRFKSRDKYPVRQFTTSSFYLNWKYLGVESYWALQDYKTKEMVIDFDTDYTKLSADRNGNYFTLYANGLEPERFYKIILKTKVYQTSYGPLAGLSDAEINTLLGSYTLTQLQALPYQEVLVDDDYIFKIVR